MNSVEEPTQLDLVVVGGGLSGVCCAITAARAGVKVVLVQDRPVLGGNASSEVRLWVLGATSHMGNNNRWAREGGVIDEILVENLLPQSGGQPADLRHHPAGEGASRSRTSRCCSTPPSTRWTKADARHDLRGPRLLPAELHPLRAHARRCSATPPATASSASWPARPSAWAPRRSEEFGEAFAPPSRVRRAARPLDVLLHQGHRPPVKFTAAEPSPLKDITQIPRYRRVQRQRLTAATSGGSSTAAASTPSTRPRRSSGSCGRSSTACGTTSRTPGSFPEAENPDARMGRAPSPASARAAASRATT